MIPQAIREAVVELRKGLDYINTVLFISITPDEIIDLYPSDHEIAESIEYTLGDAWQALRPGDLCRLASHQDASHCQRRAVECAGPLLVRIEPGSGLQHGSTYLADVGNMLAARRLTQFHLPRGGLAILYQVKFLRLECVATDSWITFELSYAMDFGNEVDKFLAHMMPG